MNFLALSLQKLGFVALIPAALVTDLCTLALEYVGARPPVSVRLSGLFTCVMTVSLWYAYYTDKMPTVLIDDWGLSQFYRPPNEQFSIAIVFDFSNPVLLLEAFVVCIAGSVFSAAALITSLIQCIARFVFAWPLLVAFCLALQCISTFRSRAQQGVDV